MMKLILHLKYEPVVYYKWLPEQPKKITRSPENCN